MATGPHEGRAVPPRDPSGEATHAPCTRSAARPAPAYHPRHARGGESADHDPASMPAVPVPITDTKRPSRPGEPGATAEDGKTDEGNTGVSGETGGSDSDPVPA